MSQNCKYVLGFILMAVFASIIFVPMGLHYHWENWHVIGNIVIFVAVYGIMCWGKDPFHIGELKDLPPKLLGLHILSYMLMSAGIAFTAVLDEQTLWQYAIGVTLLLSFAFIQRYIYSKAGAERMI